jgi:uncharacterized RDD family membrane protein YckC
VEEPRLALDTAEMPVIEDPYEDDKLSKELRRSEDLPRSEQSGQAAHLQRSPRERFAPSDRTTSISAQIDEQAGAPAGARIFAAIIDLTIVGGIDAAILYLTLRILDLHMADARALPIVPFLAFLLLLNGSYFAAFVAAGGQTIGKMASGIRVVPGASGSDHSERVPVGSAIVRAAAYLVSALPAGVGFLPGLMSSDHRALHDRLADTRVVKA